MNDIRFSVTTDDLIKSMPRITEFFHIFVNNPVYYSCGKFRQNEQHCIFHYTLAGSGETWIGDKIYRTQPGQGFFNIINDIDSGYRYPPDSNEVWEGIVLCFSGGNSREIAEDLIRKYGLLFEIPPQHPFIRRMLDQSKWNEQTIVKNDEAIELFAELFSALLTYKRIGAQEKIPPMETLLLKAKNTIARDIAANPTITEIAHHLGVSREHLSREFNKRFGMTIQSFISHERSETLKMMLLNTDLSLKELAEKMNFSSDSNLIKYFKKVNGITPSQFRQLQTP